jgi:superfamily I DNA and/or RNA helicase
LSDAGKFDVVLADETNQATEPSALVPLQYHCKRLILIGDPKQLPATVLSPTAQHFGYGTSLFERLQAMKVPVHMLQTQYRMHPVNSRFPNLQFYDGKLEDAEEIQRRWSTGIRTVFTIEQFQKFGHLRKHVLRRLLPNRNNRRNLREVTSEDISRARQ